MTEFVEEFANPRNILYVDNETRAETISKLTHLYFNGKKINDIVSDKDAGLYTIYILI